VGGLLLKSKREIYRSWSLLAIRALLIKRAQFSSVLKEGFVEVEIIFDVI